MKRIALKRRSSLTSSKPLGRKAPMKRKPARRIAREIAEDKAYKAWIHTRPCVGSYVPGLNHWCDGEVQQSHERNHTGLGLKAPNRRSVAMCWEIHRMWETRSGVFQRWSEEKRKEWFGTLVERENEAFDRRDSDG